MMNNNNPALMNQQMNMPAGYPVRMMNGVHPEGAGSPGDMAHKAGQQQQLQRNAVMQRAAAAGR